MYAIYAYIDRPNHPNVSIYGIHGVFEMAVFVFVVEGHRAKPPSVVESSGENAAKRCFWKDSEGFSRISGMFAGCFILFHSFLGT